MAKHFEELQCWQFAREMVKNVYEILKEESVQKDDYLKHQLNRAALSVMNNIAEGFGRNNNGEFCRYLEIASGSCAELRSMLYILSDFRRVKDEHLKETVIKAGTTHMKILALLRHLKNYEPSNPKIFLPEAEAFGVNFQTKRYGNGKTF